MAPIMDPLEAIDGLYIYKHVHFYNIYKHIYLTGYESHHIYFHARFDKKIAGCFVYIYIELYKILYITSYSFIVF